MPTSVMPKGVEHKPDRGLKARPPRMPTSVMPKGVEHRYQPSAARTGSYAHLCDAERR